MDERYDTKLPPADKLQYAKLLVVSPVEEMHNNYFKNVCLLCIGVLSVRLCDSHLFETIKFHS